MGTRVQSKHTSSKAPARKAKAGKRRSAVIDLGDARDPSRIATLVQAPISMSLRANSCFQIINHQHPQQRKQLIEQLELLLIDNPQRLNIRTEWQPHIEWPHLDD